MESVAIVSAGMITGVGLTAPAACAAIRVGITGFVETGFMFDGEWLIGCPVPLEEDWRGREKLLRMVEPAIRECLVPIPQVPTGEIPLILCLAESARAGRLSGLDESFLTDLQGRLGQPFHPESRLVSNGRIGGIQAVQIGRELIARGRPYCVVAGVDSYLIGATLAAYHDRHRLQTPQNSDGFIPGEAAAAVLLGVGKGKSTPFLRCIGIGFGNEPATVESGKPLRAEGMVQAFREVLRDARVTLETIDYRITDVSGEQYTFKEASLALARTLRVRKEDFDIWHPADCIGEVGAAIVPCVLGVALTAAMKGYSPGKEVLCHCGNDDGQRGALILHYSENGKA